jgi:hypothetical protein
MVLIGPRISAIELCGQDLHGHFRLLVFSGCCERGVVVDHGAGVEPAGMTKTSDLA